MPRIMWLLMGLLAWPAVELVAFILVAVTIGFGPALLLLVLTSAAGALVLRYGGGAHIDRARAAWDGASIASLRTDSAGVLVLLAGILLLIPGFVSSLVGLLLLLPPLRRAIASKFAGRPPQSDAIVDLEPEEWRRMPEPRLPDRQKEGGES